jgi:hypothetical protein
MRQFGVLSLIVCLAAATGCNVCCWGKRASELGSPTDIRKSHFWCLGEDAVFEQPCGPNKEGYGLKPTCWREWPADATRCAPGSCPGDSCPTGGCGPTSAADGPTELLMPPQTAPKPAAGNRFPDPFRDDLERLPAPADQGTNRRKSNPKSVVRAAMRIEQGPQLNSATKLNTAKKPTAALPPRPTPVRAAEPKPTPGIERPPLGSESLPALKILVSDPIDTPVQYLAPIVAPNRAGRAATPPSNPAAVETKTLAGLEQMLDIPASVSTDESAPEVVQNEFAPAIKPFRLATRATLERPARKLEVQNETLNALESMMSGSVTPASTR